MNYIYLIQSLENGYYKIGVSKHPQKRVKEHQTGNSSELKVVEEYLTDLAFQIEKVLHRRYSYARKNGEWFDIGIKEEASFQRDCKKIEENLKAIKNNDSVFI